MKIRLGKTFIEKWVCGILTLQQSSLLLGVTIKSVANSTELKTSNLIFTASIKSYKANCLEETFTFAPSHPVMKCMCVLPASATAVMVSFPPAAVVASSAPVFIIVDTAPVNFFPVPTSTPAWPTFHSCLWVEASGAFCVWHHIVCATLNLVRQ